MFILIVFVLVSERPSGLLFFVPAFLLSILTPLFLPSSSVYLISSLLFPCISVWENTRAWVPFHIAILHGTFFFARRNSPCVGWSFAYQNLIILLICVKFCDKGRCIYAGLLELAALALHICWITRTRSSGASCILDYSNSQLEHCRLIYVYTTSVHQCGIRYMLLLVLLLLLL